MTFLFFYILDQSSAMVVTEPRVQTMAYSVYFVHRAVGMVIYFVMQRREVVLSSFSHHLERG